MILRDGRHFVWSRGEELMTDRLPEPVREANTLADLKEMLRRFADRL